MEVGVIDLSNLAENTKLEELQKRLTLLEGGEVRQMPQVSAYKTPPAPVVKPEIIHKPSENPEIKHMAEHKPEPVKPAQTESVKSAEPEKNEIKEELKTDEFSPMPKSQAVDKSSDIGSLWVQLLDNISSVPVKSLLKQFATPVELSSDKVEISLKGEMYVKQFTDGSKREKLLQAVNSMFGHSNVTVRLPKPDDKPIAVENAVKKKPSIIPPTTPAEAMPEPEEVPEEVQAAEPEKEVKTHKKIDSMHSDMVNMVVEMFDGKIIE